MTETTPALDRNARNWTLASAALALLPLLLQLPPLLAGVIAAAALVTAALSWRKVLPMPVRLLLVLAMLGAIAWQMGMVRPGRDTGCALLAAMLAIKSSELRSRRDARSLLGFALFSPFAAFLLDQGPLTTALAACWRSACRWHWPASGCSRAWPRHCGVFPSAPWVRRGCPTAWSPASGWT